MTETEAIELLNSFYEMDEMYAAAQVAIQALEEIQQYRAIGLTPKMVKEFSMKKEVTKLVLCLLLTLIMGIAAFLYLYIGMYFMAGFIGLGTLNWCWISFLCIRELRVSKNWIKGTR